MTYEDIKQEKLHDAARDAAIEAYGEVLAYEDIDKFIELYVTDELIELIDKLRKDAAEHGHNMTDIMEYL